MASPDATMSMTITSPINAMSTRAIQTGPPLDYSFCDITTVEDIMDEMPRGGKRKPDASHDATGAPISAEDQHGNELAAAERAAKAAEARAVMEESLRFKSTETTSAKATHIGVPKTVTTSVKLNNNSLLSVCGNDGFTIVDALSKILWDISTLTMLDLSFNGLKSIEEPIAEIKTLQLLYMHGNEIKSITNVNKLQKLPRLKALTLHGNEVEEVQGYRNYLITRLPNLNALDFTRITDKDRTDSRHICERVGFNKTGKKKG